MDNRKRLPTPATGAPVPGTPPAGWPRQQGPGARRRTRGAAQGAGACRPTPRSALGAGRRPGGCSYSAPLGGLILVSPDACAADAYRR